ncbi:retrovirus-related pol polyprotein from transposon TNT 1-94 [Tanacetum coccineum]
MRDVGSGDVLAQGCASTPLSEMQRHLDNDTAVVGSDCTDISLCTHMNLEIDREYTRDMMRAQWMLGAKILIDEGVDLEGNEIVEDVLLGKLVVIVGMVRMMGLVEGSENNGNDYAFQESRTQAFMDTTRCTVFLLNHGYSFEEYALNHDYDTTINSVHYSGTLFLRSKDETPEVLKEFLTMIQRNLQALVISVRTDRGTEFLNKTLHAFFKEEGIEHQTSTPRTPEQNGVAEAIATACYTQNRSIIIPTHEKTAYHIINDRKPSIKHLHIFGCTCYLTRDGENLDKMKEKGDPCILVGYSTQSKGYRVYNKRTRLIVESIHLRFDEIKEMSETSVANDTSGLVPQRQKASDYDNSDPDPQLQNVSPSAKGGGGGGGGGKQNTTVPSQQELDLLFGPLYDEFFNAGTSRVNKSSSPTDNSAQQDTLPSTNIHPTTEPSTPTHVNAEENNNDQAEFTNPFCTPVQEVAESSSRNIVSANKTTTYNRIREMCMFALHREQAEPKNIKEAMADSEWIEAMQKELHQFDRLQVWELVDKPFGKNVIKLKWLWKNKKDEDQTVIRNKA